MKDEELIAQSAGLPTLYFDGFGAYRKVNGVLRCIGWTIDGGAQLNLIVSLYGADLAQQEAKRVLSEEPVKGLKIWNSPVLVN